MLYIIDGDPGARRRARARFAASEEVVDASDWTPLVGRLALADPTTDALILATCRSGTEAEALWRLLGHDASGVPTVIWTEHPERVAPSCTAEVVDKATDLASLQEAVRRARQRRNQAG